MFVANIKDMKFYLPEDQEQFLDYVTNKANQASFFISGKSVDISSVDNLSKEDFQAALVSYLVHLDLVNVTVKHWITNPTNFTTNGFLLINTKTVPFTTKPHKEQNFKSINIQEWGGGCKLKTPYFEGNDPNIQIFTPECRDIHKKISNIIGHEGMLLKARQDPTSYSFLGVEHETDEDTGIGYDKFLIESRFTNNDDDSESNAIDKYFSFGK